MVNSKVSTIENNVVVTMDYHLEVEGQEIDSGPIQFIQGQGNIIPGLERQIAGMAVGEEKEVQVEAKDAYGAYDPEMEIEVPLSSFPEDFDIQLGRPMRMQDGEGHTFTGIAIAITDKSVKLNLNHPLAGKDLVFKVGVKELRAATDQEIKQGHLPNDCAGCGTDGCAGCG